MKVLQFLADLVRPGSVRNRATPPLAQWERHALNRSEPIVSSAHRAAMLRDSMVGTALSIKRLGVLSGPFRIVGQDAARVAFVEEAFARMEGSPAGVLNDAMSAFATGWSVLEPIYTFRDGRIWLQRVEPRDIDRFAPEFDDYGNLNGLRTLQPEVRLPIERFIVYRYRATAKRPHGTGDLDSALPHYLAKRNLLEAWDRHLANFASPTMIGRVPRTVSQAEADMAFRALSRLRESAAITLPADIEIDHVGGETVASGGFMEAIDFHNREIARCILGQTLTTDEGRRVGSLALGKVHLQVLLMQLAALRRELADTVMTEQLIRPLIEANFGPGEVPRFEFEEGEAISL